MPWPIVAAVCLAVIALWVLVEFLYQRVIAERDRADRWEECSRRLNAACDRYHETNATMIGHLKDCWRPVTVVHVHFEVDGVHGRESFGPFNHLQDALYYTGVEWMHRVTEAGALHQFDRLVLSVAVTP